jgi:hypothetical protein
LTNARASLSTFLIAASLAACGSSSNEPPDTGARPDAATDGGADAIGAGADADGQDTLDAEPTFVPPAGTRRLVAGSAVLIGSGSDSCTNQPGATADRWCAFLVPSQTAGRFELWVIDATEAASGADVACDGTDTRCFRIATDAFREDGAGSLDGGFAGDTLLYRRGPDATVDDGPIWAWRPGWATGRELITGLGTTCFAAPTYASAFCLRTSQSVAAGSEANDLVAGLLDSPDGGPLALVDTIVTRGPKDPDGSSANLELGFSPDGKWVAWSTNGVPSAQGLEVQKIGDPPAPIPVATDVSDWQMSSDDTAWLWLRSYTDDIIAPSGTLEMAAFPDGTGVTTLQANVANYEPVGAKGLLVRANVADQVGELRYMADRTTPTTSVLLDQGVRAVVARSADASTVIYSKVSTAVGVDLFAWSASLAAPCTLTSTPAAFSIAQLMAAGKVIVWARRDVISQVVSGAITTLASCDTQSFGQNLIQSIPANDDRLLFIDGAPSGSTSGTLRVAAIAADGAPGAGTPLQRNVDVVFAPIAPDGVIYTVGGDAASGGLYLYAGALLAP